MIFLLYKDFSYIFSPFQLIMDAELLIFWSVFIFLWIVYLWDTYLSIRQRRILKKVHEIPKEVTVIMNQETFEKARLYGIDKSSYGIIHSVVSQLEFSTILCFNLIPKLWFLCVEQSENLGLPNEIPQSMLFIFYASLFSNIFELPWDIYRTFVIEEKHGFNQQTLAFFLKDRVKKFFVLMLIILPVVSGLIFIIKAGGPYFYVYAWGFTLVITIFMMFIYPEFIAPLFDRYEPLPNGELREAIEALAASIEFPLKKLYVVEGSKRSAHSNAYFYGFWKNKRIVLFDTLIENFVFPGKETVKTEETTEEKEEGATDDEPATPAEKPEKSKKKTGCNNEEVLAVLGHELGHWKMNHVTYNLVISQVNIFLMFFVLGLLLNMDVLFQSFGFKGASAPTIARMVIVFQFIFSPYNEVLGFVMTKVSRKFEFQADAFAVRLSRGLELKSALAKLCTDNLSFPVHDWLYSAFNFSHPPMLERLKAIDVEREHLKTKSE